MARVRLGWVKDFCISVTTTGRNIGNVCYRHHVFKEESVTVFWGWYGYFVVCVFPVFPVFLAILFLEGPGLQHN